MEKGLRTWQEFASGGNVVILHWRGVTRSWAQLDLATGARAPLFPASSMAAGCPKTILKRGLSARARWERQGSPTQPPRAHSAPPATSCWLQESRQGQARSRGENGAPIPERVVAATLQRSMWNGLTFAANFGKHGLPWQSLAVGSSKDDTFSFVRAEFEVPPGLRRRKGHRD